MEPTGLSATQLTILQVLARAGEVTQGQLGEMPAMDSTSLTRTLAVMGKQRNQCVAVARDSGSVVAVGSGTLSRVLDPNGISMLAMTMLPLSLVPTFLVPLLLIFHVTCIAQARGWRSGLANERGSARAFGYRAV